MRREIKFRGKRIEDGEWVYGGLWDNRIIAPVKLEYYYLIFDKEWDLEAQINFLSNPKDFSHCSESVHKVIPETVGQFTGLCDKNGKEIYEQDILKVHIFTQELGENMGVVEGEKEFIASLHFSWEGIVLVNKKGENSGPLNCYYGFEDPEEQLEVIGDIYTTPELLEENKQ